LLARAFSLGNWKNIKEMEDTLTMEELTLLVEATYDKEDQDRKFLAALQGIDLNEESDSAFDAVERRAQADLAGVSEEQYVFDMIGIVVEDDDE
jgi:hypothetical protein